MALDNDIAALRTVSLFRELDRDQLRLLAFSGERRRLAQGETVCRPGETARGALVVVAGRLSVAHRPGETRDALPGALLGETALLTPSVWSFEATAAEPAEVIEIGRAAFRRMMVEYPSVARRLHGLVTARLANLARALGDLAPRFED